MRAQADCRNSAMHRKCLVWHCSRRGTPAIATQAWLAVVPMQRHRQGNQTCCSEEQLQAEGRAWRQNQSRRADCSHVRCFIILVVTGTYLTGLEGAVTGCDGPRSNKEPCMLADDCFLTGEGGAAKKSTGESAGGDGGAGARTCVVVALLKSAKLASNGAADTITSINVKSDIKCAKPTSSRGRCRRPTEICKVGLEWRSCQTSLSCSR